MIVEAIIERLRERMKDEFALIDGASELAAVVDTKRPPASPACFVVSMQEEAGDNERMTNVLQRVEMDVAVVLVVSNLTDATGAAARKDIEPLKRQLRETLLGWKPDGAEDVLTLVSGRMTNSKGGTFWWEELFATAYFIETNGEVQ